MLGWICVPEDQNGTDRNHHVWDGKDHRYRKNVSCMHHSHCFVNKWDLFLSRGFVTCKACGRCCPLLLPEEEDVGLARRKHKNEEIGGGKVAVQWDYESGGGEIERRYRRWLHFDWFWLAERVGSGWGCIQKAILWRGSESTHQFQEPATVCAFLWIFNIGGRDWNCPPWLWTHLAECPKRVI